MVIFIIHRIITNHLLELSEAFMFIYDNLENIESKSSLIVVLNESISSKRILLEKISMSLKFPPYFGENWDALNDCLNDLSWITEKDIDIIHRDIPKLEMSDLLIYISILQEVLINWDDNKQHKINVYFHIDMKEYIEKLINLANNEEQ